VFAGDSVDAADGGRLEANESYLDAARRELLEETGFAAPVLPLNSRGP
jgi:ADP-ribose pyrophosphatase YjhB (NUDIX family)